MRRRKTGGPKRCPMCANCARASPSKRRADTLLRCPMPNCPRSMPANTPLADRRGCSLSWLPRAGARSGGDLGAN
jgi:hypothetical protein